MDPECRIKANGSVSTLRIKQKKELKPSTELLVLQETMARLEQDNAILREREVKDRDTIKSLLKEIQSKDRELLCNSMPDAESIPLLEYGGHEDKNEADEGVLVKSFINKKPRSRKQLIHGKDEDFRIIELVGKIAQRKLGSAWGKKSNRGYRSKKKFKMSDSGCSSMVAWKGHQSYWKRNSKKQKPRKYTRAVVYSEKQLRALDRAKEVKSSLKLTYPSFIKSMVPTCVCRCFMLGLPTAFCRKYLSEETLRIVLEDEQGLEHYAVYIGRRFILSGGWRGFALDHNLEVGDALIFELIEPTRFKVYIIKANLVELRENYDPPLAELIATTPLRTIVEGSNPSKEEERHQFQYTRCRPIKYGPPLLDSIVEDGALLETSSPTAANSGTSGIQIHFSENEEDTACT